MPKPYEIEIEPQETEPPDDRDLKRVIEPEQIVDDTIQFPNTEETARVGMHAGVISEVIPYVQKTDKGDRTLVRFVITVEQQDIYGDPLTATCDVPCNGEAHGSYLRELLYQLGFQPPKDGNFKLKSVEGTEVDVYVYHTIGDNDFYRWAKVAPRDLHPRGQGIDRTAEVNMKDIVVVSKAEQERVSRRERKEAQEKRRRARDEEETRRRARKESR